MLIACTSSVISAGSAYWTIARDHVSKSAWGRLSNWVSSTLSTGEPLYDVDGNVIAWGFDVVKSGKTIGYVIVNAVLGASDPVFEYGNGSGLPFNSFVSQAFSEAQKFGSVLETRYVYPRVLTYAIQMTLSNGGTANVHYWLPNKGFVTRNYAGLRRPSVNATVPQPDTGITATEEVFLPGVVPDYQWYRGCSPTAANLLRYWNNYGYPGFPSGNTLIDELADAMGTDSDRYTYLSDIPGGIPDVCYGYGYSDWTSWNDSLG